MKEMLQNPDSTLPDELTLQDFKKKINENFLVIDTRNVEEFTTGFIPGSIFIGWQGKFAEWAKSLLTPEQPILFIALEGKENEIFEALVNAGFKNVAGYLKGGYQSWKDGGENTDLIIDIEADEMAMDIPFDNNILVLDVRQPDEFAEGHVKNALNLPLSDMADVGQIASFDDDQSLYIHCAGGYRSVVAASLLKRQGYHNLRNISGGFKKIKEEKSINIEKDPSLLN